MKSVNLSILVDALCDDIYNYNRSEMTDNKE